MRCLRRLEHARRGGGARDGAPKGLGRGKGRKLAFVGLDRRPPRRRRGAPAASPSSTASAAAAWCRARRCWSAAIPASANRPCCCRWWRRWPRAKAARRSIAPTSRARNRSTRCGCARRASASPARRCSSPPPPASATSSPRSTDAGAPDVVVDRFDPDHVSRHARQRARHGEPGARLGAGADPARQGARLHRDAGRPRHQGRPHRRPARARAHGRHRALFRGRARPPVPHPARGQEPLRPDRRDRRVRDDRCRPRRGAQPVGAVPRRPPAARPRGAAVFAGIEGTRPMLVEIQALVAPSTLGTPRRAVVGWDGNRLAMVLAVLEARCGVRSAPTTSISTSPAACASPSPRPISRWRRRWSRR